MSSEVDELREVLCAIGAKAIRIMINLARSCGVWRMLAEKYAAQSDRGLFNAALMTVMCAGFVSRQRAGNVQVELTHVAVGRYGYSSSHLNILSCSGTSFG